ncbi:DUF1194 domain-containing protein [Microvirga sp. P5_D2]
MLRAVLAVVAAACLSLVVPAIARAGTEVDLALVLAVDVSRSMDPEKQELQRQGFIEAFRSPLVHDAIRNCMLGRVTVIYVEWSGVEHQVVIAPWTVIDSPETAMEFAEKLDRTEIGRVRRTSISGAIDFGVGLLDQIGATAMRKVIDISGDGPNSSGRSVVEARDEATARGITINGLPIMLKRPSGFGDMENLDLYYRNCVIGGPGSFLVPVREREQFAQAIRTKIIREIAGSQFEPLIRKVQAEAPANCSAGERRMYQRDRN